MYRSTAFALAALAGMFALAARGADPAEKMAGTWVGNFDNKTKDYVTVKLEDGKWSVSGVLKAGDKEVGSYTGDDCSLKGDALQFKRTFTKKPFPSAKDGEVFTASLDKGELVLTHKVGKNKVSARYTTEAAKVDPKVEAKGELLTKPADALAKPGDTVRLLVVVGDKVGISEKHFEALKKGKITKLEATFAGFEEPEQRLVVSEVGEQPKELELAKGTYRMAVVFDRGGSLKGLEVPNVPAFMYFCSVKLPAQSYLADIKFVGEVKGKYKARTADATEGAIYVLEAKVVKWSK